MEWISPNQGNILSIIEGETIIPIKIEIGDSENYAITKVSGDFPNGISLVKRDNNYYLEGTLDLVSETTEYYFTLHALDENSLEYIQRWFSIIVETKNTQWDDNNKLSFEEYEKTYFSYQFNLIDAEGNETFKKISGELPEGVFLSKNGLLYGVPEENREESYSFMVGIFRNDNLLFKSPKMVIKIDDISLLNKPIWVTDEGLLDYIEYNKRKELYVRAFDPKGRTVYYEKGDLFNLPYDLSFENNNTTGEINGICRTRISNNWDFEVRPYVYDENNEKIYGDYRTFRIITNASEQDNLITWITDEFDTVKIGFNYSLNIEAKSRNKIYFEIINGKLPSGLNMDRNGNIFGTVDYQDLGDYTFIVRAYTQLSFDTKEFTISVKKGLPLNSIDVFLYINKENQQSYQEMLMKYDRTSAYKPNNSLYKISSMPKIDVCTLKTWDDILLKYKFEQFNTPIDIIWKQTEKKSFTNYDFFYKDFNEINGKEWGIKQELKLHSSDETIMTNRYGIEFRPGYIRNTVNKDDLRVEFKTIDPEGGEGEVIEDIENIKKEIVGDKIRYYYVDPVTGDEYLVSNPKYYFGSREIDPTTIDDYAEFGRAFVIENVDDLDDESKYIYIQPISIGRYYEKDSKKIVNISEPIYISHEVIDNEEIITQYILNGNEKIIVLPIKEEEQYCSYNPRSKNDDMYYIDVSKYDKIRYTKIIDNYYEFGSETIEYQPTSIEGIREVFKEEFTPTKYEGNLWYKVGNQQIIYKKNGEIEDYSTFKYILKKEDNDVIVGHINSNGDVYNPSGILIWKIVDDEILDTDGRKVGYVGKNKKFIFNNDNEKIGYITENNDIYNNGIETYSVEYIGDGDKQKLFFYVYKKMDDNSYKQVFAKVGDEFKPVIQKACILEGNVDFIFYTVYKQGSKLPFTNALFICEWDENLKYTCNYNAETGVFEWFRVNEANNPYVYFASENENYGYDKDIILPNITEEYIENGKVKFLDEELEKELLPEYMEDSPIDNWKIGVNYNVNNKVIYNGYEYTCIIKHTSDYVFNSEKWLKGENIKKYKPTLPLYFAIPNSHNAILKNINDYEKKGNYWYGRKFIFYEVHFSPRYRNEDNFTIDFYNHKNENSPEFQLI